MGVAPDGRFGWAGSGTSSSVDLATGRIVLLATQRMPPSLELVANVDAASSR